MLSVCHLEYVLSDCVIDVFMWTLDGTVLVASPEKQTRITLCMGA